LENIKSDFFDYLKTDDALSIRFGVWPATPQSVPTQKFPLVFLNGRTEFMEKHHETIAELNQKGFDVYSMDWRGQGLSSRMLPERHKGYVKSYTDYIRDLDRFLSQVVYPKTKEPITILAHSMGGHIALRYAHDHPNSVRKLILLSPMIDIVTRPFPMWVADAIIRSMIRRGYENRYVPLAKNYLLSNGRFWRNKLTSDASRFMDDKKAILANPNLAVGGVTYGWLAATFESIKILNHPDFATHITQPVLFFIAGKDRIVSSKKTKILCSIITNGTCIRIPSARHEILKEVDAIRSVFWKEFDRFMLDKKSS